MLRRCIAAGCGHGTNRTWCAAHWRRVSPRQRQTLLDAWATPYWELELARVRCHHALAEGKMRMSQVVRLLAALTREAERQAWGEGVGR